MVHVLDAAPTLRESPQHSQHARTLTSVPRLSVVIVNYCQWENTAALVRKLQRSAAMRAGVLEIVIVDNHSPRHKLIPWLRRCPGVSLRRWGRNRGFACAVNEGCRLSRGEWFLLLNPDMSLTTEFIDGVSALALEIADQEPAAGIVGFHLRNSDGSRQYSAGRDPTLTRTVAGLAWPRARRKYQRVTNPSRCQVPWVTGCCFLIRGDCWRDLGGLGEEYFLYYEDVDLCRRARARGWTVWYEPSLQAVHHSPIHVRKVTSALRLITRHSLLTYSARHWAGWQFRLLARIVCLEAWVRQMLARWRADETSAELFREMGKLAGDLLRDDQAGARRRLERVVNEHGGALVSQVRTPEARDLAAQSARR